MNSVTINKIINLFFKNLTHRQIILRNSFWIVAGKFISGVLRALLVILAARFLGAGEYGSFSLAMNFVLLFSFLPELGLTAILTREISKANNQEEKYSIFNNILIISLILSIISYFLIITLGYFFLKDSVAKIILPILALMLIFDILREFAYAVYRAELKSELQGIFHFLTNLLLFIIGFSVLINFRTSISLAYGYFIAITIGFIISNLFLFNYFRNFKFSINYRLWLYYFNSSWPIALANALYLMLLFIDSIILGWFFPNYVVGIYTSSIKINEFLIVFPTGIALAMLPIFSKNLSDKSSLRKNLEFSFQLTYLIILPIILGGFLLSEKLILFIFGNEYLSAHYAFKILIPSLLASSLFMIFSQLLIALNKRIELLIYEFIVIIINFIGNLLIIPYFDFLGAAYITTLSSFLSFLFGYFILNKYVEFNIYSGILKPLIASLIMAGILILLSNLNTVILILLGILLYFIALILLKEEISLKILKVIVKIK
jgi:O-antigen/teichoic acid export membrane protein